MQLHTLPKITRRKRRRGRGIGSQGAKSGRGMKGQRSRAGSFAKAGFEGGQTPLYMRLPKGRGAKQRSISQVQKPVAIPIKQLNRFASGMIVGPAQLLEQKLINFHDKSIKIIGGGELKHKLTVRTHGVTAGARASIESAGGKVEIIEKKNEVNSSKVE